MRVGDLRKRVVIQRREILKDTEGLAKETWVTVKEVFAAIEPLNGREFFSAQVVNSEIDTKIRIRYMSLVETSMRVLYGTRVFDIQSVINVKEQKRELVLMCKELI